MVAGYRVFVCDNMALSGDFNPLLAKHSKNFDLIESVSIGIDRIQRNWNPLRVDIDRKRNTLIDPDQARLLIYKAFANHKLPVSLFNTVAKTYEQESGEENTLWDIEQCFTGAFKNLKPIAHFQAASKLATALRLPA